MAPLSYENLHNYSKNANFDKLTHLKCYGRNISNVQIFKNNPIPNLKVLNLSVNNLENLEGLENCSNLVELYVRNNKLSNLINCINILVKLSHLKSLWIDGNLMLKNDTEIEILVRALPNLERLNGKKIANLRQELGISEPPAKNQTPKSTQDLGQEKPPSFEMQNPTNMDLLSPKTQNLTASSSNSTTSGSYKAGILPSSDSPASKNTLSPEKSNESLSIHLGSPGTAEVLSVGASIPVDNQTREIGSTLEMRPEATIGPLTHGVNVGAKTAPSNHLNHSNILTASLALLSSLSKDELLVLKNAVEVQVSNLEIDRVDSILE